MRPGESDNIWSKLNALYANNNELFPAQLEIIKSDLRLFLNGGPLQLRFTMDTFQREINNLVVAGLLIIYTYTTNEKLKKAAKQVIKNSLDPLLNQSLAFQLVNTYNKKNGQFPITSLTEDVKIVMKRTFEYYFDYLWDRWITQNTSQGQSSKSGFIPYVYHTISGAGGTQTKGGFPYFWNQTNKPEKTKPPEANLSKIISYVYGSKDMTRIDAFNAANIEIVNHLKQALPISRQWKVFDHVVGSKLDSSEIVAADKEFKDEKDVANAFQQLKSADVSGHIDKIYRKYKLNLPPFKTWIAADLNKGPSDRRQLQPEPPEMGRDPKGNLAKIKYDKYGDKSYTPLQELRLMVRSVLIEFGSHL